MDDFLSRYLSDDVTIDEIRAKEAESLKAAEFTFVLKEGKVYFEADNLLKKFSEAARMGMTVAYLKNDASLSLISQGLAVASEILSKGQGEILRREAEKSL
jgi:hypothetical protein